MYSKDIRHVDEQPFPCALRIDYKYRLVARSYSRLQFFPLFHLP